MVKKLKIYSDKSWLPSGRNHTIMLYPFWGEIPLPQGDPDAGRFDDYMLKGKETFEMVNTISESETLVLPFEFYPEKEGIEMAQNVSKISKEKNKKLIVFYNNDDPSGINIDNSIIFRTSFLKSKQKLNEFALPGWSVDFLKKYSSGNVKALPKKEKPEISYCGYVDNLEEPSVSIKQRINKIFETKDFFGQGSLIRGKAVRYLLKDNGINSQFVIRNGFWAEGIADKNEARKQYAENMMNSPYALVTRGAGNFSYRLYEVMSCGRIPVFINTDSVLPYDNFIDWKKSCVWVEENEINNLSNKLVNFHNSISSKDFENMQIENRKIYEEWLCPTGFFKNAHRNLN